MFMNNNDKIVDAIMYWMVFLWIYTGACALGLILSILKVILNAFGIDNPL